MAYASTSGYNNLPNGVFVPEIYSAQVQLGFRRKTFINEVVTTDYYGEIQKFGDTVHIIKEPDITLQDYARGKKLVPQDIIDEEITLTVDQDAAYSFRLEDIEVQQSHVDYEGMLVDRAAYKLAQRFETNVLDAMYAGVDSGNVIGTTGAPKAIGYDTSSDDFTPLEAIDELVTTLMIDDVPMDEIFFVANPRFLQLLKKEDSKFIDASVMGTSESPLMRPPQFFGRMLNGVDVYITNNAVTDTSKAVLLAGHKSATAAAHTLVKSKVDDLEGQFAQQFSGLAIWGRKVLRPTALAAMITDIATS
jgi:hypothetical protein